MSSIPSVPPGSLKRWIAALLGLSLALLVACAILLWLLAARTGARPDNELLKVPELREEVIARLVSAAGGIDDSHPDADVGRVLVPSIERSEEGLTLRTNRVGMREHDYAIPKPPGVVRVVVLGDSFVYGGNCPAEVRLGAQLERHLEERQEGPAQELEVLHLGVSSWNLVSECAYLRRQLDRLGPDLVVQVTHNNDLNDVSGVRGFGVLSSFAPAHPERADSLLGAMRIMRAGLGGAALLPLGLGWESRSRFDEARASVLGLVAALAASAQKARYLLVVYWGRLSPVLHERLGRFLDADSLLYIPLEFWMDRSTWVTPSDNHWNATGHERVARVLYGLIRQRGLLPSLEQSPWLEAEEEARSFAEAGWQEAQVPCQEVERALAELSPVLDMESIDPRHALQIYGGIDNDRLVSPYASLLLAQPVQFRALRVSGRALPDIVLAGALVHVWLEDRELGTIVLEPDREFEFRAEVPPELRGREPLSVRLVSDDYVYRGDDLRHCVVFKLRSVALE